MHKYIIYIIKKKYFIDTCKVTSLKSLKSPKISHYFICERAGDLGDFRDFRDSKYLGS